MMRHDMRFSFVATFLVLGACGLPIPNEFLPNETTLVRRHPLGVMVYNKSGEEIKEDRWKEIFSTIEEAYYTLRNCVGFREKESFDLKLRSGALVILPRTPLVINGRLVDGFADRWWPAPFTPIDVYLRLPAVSLYQLRHEWIHHLLWLGGKRYQSLREEHEDPLFQKCA